MVWRADGHGSRSGLGALCPDVGSARSHDQHELAAGLDAIIGNRRQLDPGLLPPLLQPLGLTGVLLDEHLVVAGQVSQLPNRRRRHNNAPHESMLQQLRDPGGVLHVGLPSRHVAHVGGVDQKTADGVIEHVVDWLLVHAGALQGDIRHAMGC